MVDKFSSAGFVPANCLPQARYAQKQCRNGEKNELSTKKKKIRLAGLGQDTFFLCTFLCRRTHGTKDVNWNRQRIVGAGGSGIY